MATVTRAHADKGGSVIDPVMLFCVSGVALAVALLVVFGSWVEAVAAAERDVIRAMLATEKRDDEST